MMKNVIAQKFSDILCKCILRYAKKANVSHENLFVLLTLENDGEPGYKIMINKPGVLNFDPFINIPEGHTPTVQESITILNVLDVRFFHIMGYHELAPPYISAGLKALAAQNQISESKVSALVCTNTQDVFLILCEWDSEKGVLTKMIKQVDIVEFF